MQSPIIILDKSQKMSKTNTPDTDFDSYYNLDDLMQSDEYEGDDFLDLSKDEVLSQMIRSSSIKNQRSLRLSTKRSNSNLNLSDEIYGSKQYSLELDNILSVLDETIDDEGETISRSLVLNETQVLDELKIDNKKLNMVFLEAIKINKTERILKMISYSYHKGLLDVNYKNEEGMNSILLCCMTGNLDILKILVNEYNGNPSVINSINKRVGFHYACMYNNHEIMSFLLTKNYKDCTPLFYAALNNSEKCVEILLNYEANIHLKNKENFTAYEVTTSYNIQKMIEKKLNSNTQFTNSNTYNRTQILNSNKLSRNSRMDRVFKLLDKSKETYNYLKEQTIQPYEEEKEKFHETKQLIETQVTPIQNKLNETQSKPKGMKFNKFFRDQLEQSKIFIKAQKESQERCNLFLDKLKKRNSPIKLNRKVTLDDFIFYRMIGEGSFGQVYLVKFKEGILKVNEDSKENFNTQDKLNIDLINDSTKFNSIENESAQVITQKDIKNVFSDRNQDQTSELKQEQCQNNKTSIENYSQSIVQSIFESNKDNDIDPSKKFYALKIYRKEALKKKKISSYIEFEKSVLREVQHPFIAKLHLTFENESNLFMLMDFYEGGNLGKILAQDAVIPEQQVKVWAAQIILALEELHKNDIIYRDLKPENLVLDQKGNLHLIDFGLSKRGAHILTSSFCGTPIYIPPEIVDRSGHNKMVDWYSLGVIIYELLIGRPPYFSTDCKQLFNDIQTQPLRLPKQIPEQQKSILISLLKKNYKLRLGFERDAEEVKEHPWFADINWEMIKQKQIHLFSKLNLLKKYECYKPTLLKIPTKPMEIKIKQNQIYDNMEFKDKWSYYNIDEPKNQKQ